MKKLIKILALAISVMTVFSMTSFASTTEKDYEIPGCWIAEENGHIYCEWEKPEDSTGYKLRVYRDPLNGGSTKLVYEGKLQTRKKEITSYIAENGTGDYFFTVYPTKGKTSQMIESDTLNVDSDYLKFIKQVAVTTLVTESTDPVYTWKQEGSTWHLFKDGVQVYNGWHKVNNYWYYIDAKGNMLTGWQKLAMDGKYYYLEPVGNSTYPQGACWMNTTTPDGFKVDKNGAWIK